MGTSRAATDFTGQVDIKALHPGTKYYYRVGSDRRRHRRLHNRRRDRRSIAISGQGSFQTAPSPNQSKTVRFAWVADLAGQGWGRNPEFKIKSFDGETIQGGYVVFDVIRKFKPDFAPETEGLPANMPPSKTDLQFFGLAEVDGQTAKLTVQIRDITGKLAYEKVLQPD